MEKEKKKNETSKIIFNSWEVEVQQITDCNKTKAVQSRKIAAKHCFLLLNESGKKQKTRRRQPTLYEVPPCAIHEFSVHFMHSNIPLKKISLQVYEGYVDPSTKFHLQ